MPAGNCYIGTSGWDYNHWHKLFYPENLPEGHCLECYAREFRTAEINNSFYKLPEINTYRKWAGQTPDDFIFAEKAKALFDAYEEVEGSARAPD